MKFSWTICNFCEKYTVYIQIELDFNAEHTCLKRKTNALSVDFLKIIQDSGWLVSLSFNVSETKHIIEKSATNVIVALKLLINNQVLSTGSKKCPRLTEIRKFSLNV